MASNKKNSVPSPRFSNVAAAAAADSTETETPDPGEQTVTVSLADLQAFLAQNAPKRGPGRPKGSKNKPAENKPAETKSSAAKPSQDVVIPRQGGWELRVGRSEYNGKENIQIRAWGTSPTGQKFAGKGATIQPAELPAVIAALQSLL